MDENKVNAFVDALRTALDATHADGYETAKYAHNVNKDTAEARRMLNAAHTRESSARVAMWNAFYNMMDEG
jgi:tellurite resistance protein